MEGTFILRITFGNDAMSEPEHLAWALRKLADKAEAGGVRTSGAVMDVNGNAVGTWSIA